MFRGCPICWTIGLFETGYRAVRGRWSAKARSGNAAKGGVNDQAFYRSRRI
jgi:hypothetical protein